MIKEESKTISDRTRQSVVPLNSMNEHNYRHKASNYTQSLPGTTTTIATIATHRDEVGIQAKKLFIEPEPCSIRYKMYLITKQKLIKVVSNCRILAKAIKVMVALLR